MNTAPFEIERTFDVPTHKVWQAITDKNKMKEWYFEIEHFEPKVGFEFTFYGDCENQKFLHLCKITEVVEGSKLTYSWSYDDEPGMSYVTFELFAEGDKTRLKLTHAGLHTFPADKPVYARESFEEGWNDIIGKSLKTYLEADKTSLNRA